MNPQTSKRYLKILLAILVFVLVLLCVFLVRQYYIGLARPAAPISHPHSLSANDVGLIEPWMTFDYVSASYKVPSAYLQSALGIPVSTPRYPNVTLAHYAKTAATSSLALTKSVRAAVQSYLNQSGE